MKKFFSIICICLVIVFSIPNVSFAMSSSDLCVRCRSTVPEEVGGLPGVLYGSVFPDSTENNVLLREQVIESLNDFDYSLLDNYDYWCLGVTTISGSESAFSSCIIAFLGFDSSVLPCYVSDNTYTSRTSNYFYAQLNSTYELFSSYVTTTSYNAWSSGSYGNFINSNTGNSSVYGSSQNSFAFILDCNFSVYAAFEAAQNSGISGGIWGSTSVKEWFFNGGYSECTDIFADTQGYDLNGNVVDSGGSGVEIESNENHMYFESVDIGFCEPKNISSFSSFNGAYFYVRYTVDDWVVNHISDYRLDFQANWYVGDRQYNSHVTLALDRDGCITIPFSDLLDTTFENGFVVVQNKNVTLDQNFYKSFLYSISGGSEGADEWFNKMIAIYQQVIVFTPDGTSFLNSIKDTYKNMLRYDPFIIRAQCKLVDFDGNQSGAYAVKFDLVTGDDTVVDSSGMTNDDPFEPDDTSDDSYVPSVPSEGNSTSTQVVIYNGGQWTGNFDGTIGFDPGYSDLKNDLVADPNGNFTQYLNPLQADETVGWFASFVNYMPAEMKAILITGAGVGVLFGIYRFIRRG